MTPYKHNYVHTKIRHFQTLSGLKWHHRSLIMQKFQEL
jgi:hypothetical protein